MTMAFQRGVKPLRFMSASDDNFYSFYLVSYLCCRKGDWGKESCVLTIVLTRWPAWLWPKMSRAVVFAVIQSRRERNRRGGCEEDVGFRRSAKCSTSRMKTMMLVCEVGK
jgi:hypothetical protein